jgi:3',5'-cyclic AMP phosphodiesterase CpdA
VSSVAAQLIEEEGLKMDLRASLPITRRQALAAGACGLLAGTMPVAFHFGASAPAGSRAEGFHFLVVNDLHVMAEGCGVWLGRVARCLQQAPEPIDFCLVLGDLAHDGTPDQLRLACRALANFGMPVYTVIGNHDHNHPSGRKTYEELFPDRINYHFKHKGWQFVGLDSTLGPLWERTFPIQPHTMRWLKTTLPKLAPQKPTVLFTHFPLGPDVPGQSTNAGEVLALFERHRLTNALSGHLHRLTWRRVGRVSFTTNHCFSFREPNHDGFKEKAYFLCTANPDGTVRRRRVQLKPA